MSNFKPNGLITAFISVLIIGLVFSSAIIVRVYVTGATLYEQYQKDNKSKQSNTAKTPAPISRNSPENNYNSYSNSNNYSSYTTPTITPTPTSTPTLALNNSNSYSNNTESANRSNSDSYIDKNGNKNDTEPKKFYGRVIKSDATLKLDDGTTFPLKMDEFLNVFCKSGTDYRVDNKYLNGTISGYDFEFTTSDKDVGDCI